MNAQPAVLYVHGGGWSAGNPSEGYEPWACPLLEQHGFRAVSARYRLSTEAVFPAQLEDVRAELQQLKRDHEWVGVWGFSAGGHLAALAGLVEDVRAVALGSAVTDLTIDGGLVGLHSEVTQMLLGGRSELAAEASPVNHVAPGAPPFLIAHGTADPDVPFEHALRMRAALEAVGAQVEFHAITDANHFWLPAPGVLHFGELALDFFVRHLTPQPE